ncbi:MAG TPA: DUF6152 family protein [Vicinamibacterales bacterium]|nr:DUF6152 family protein [Vicinamibacterales bacterium]
MITTRTFAIGAAMVLGVTAAASGHHSFAAYYFEDQSMHIEGEIVEVQFKAPHTWVHVNTRDSSGGEKRYAAEWANPSRLERDGMTKDTLKVADVVRIWGSPSRDPNDGRIHLKRIVRPSDGWEWRSQRR